MRGGQHAASLGELRELAKRGKRERKNSRKKPSNFYIEYTFSTGGIRKRTLLKVYARGARLD
ncbi:MAG: hypothetical protein LM590_10125 [Thermofilum sp.]|nr:hypothetical protein [Thermofilum sp.]